MASVSSSLTASDQTCNHHVKNMERQSMNPTSRATLTRIAVWKTLRMCLDIRWIAFMLLYTIIWVWWEELKYNVLESQKIVAGEQHKVLTLHHNDKDGQPAQSMQAFAPPDDKMSEFCVEWHMNTDDWWTHHPDWMVTYENKSHYCMGPMDNEEKAQFFRELYSTQFPSPSDNSNRSCSNIHTREMVNQGWGADMRGVFEGLGYGWESRRPVQFVFTNGKPWIYTVGPQAVVNGTRQFINEQAAQTKACPSTNMECYFLPLTNCSAGASTSTVVVEPPHRPTQVHLDSQRGGWILEYATRAQTTLRHRVYKFLTSDVTPDMETPCSVLHVRRADVVINPFSDVTRRYHPIDDYMDAAKDILQDNILLLTDDQNAIAEAEHKFPQMHWMYLRRPRHRGAEGGFENQIPSGDPVQEVVVLLATFRLVRHCTSIVHTFSSFPYYLRAIMQDRGDDTLLKVDMDDDKHASNSVWKAGNGKLSLNVSQAYDRNSGGR